MRSATSGSQAPKSRDDTHARVRGSFRAYAAQIARRRKTRRSYVEELIRRYRFYTEPEASVLEIGVGTGDLLASLRAKRAVGIDISSDMLAVAAAAHPELELHELDAESPADLGEPFDYIILSDLTVHLHDVAAVFRNLHRYCHRRTRLLINYHSRVWQPALEVLRLLGLHHAHARTNWLTTEDLTGLLWLSGFEVVKTDVSTLLPAPVPGARLVNRVAPRLPLVGKTALVNWIVARPVSRPVSAGELSVSVVVAARNESGNIANIVDSVPAMGRHTELIFVEGGSSDDTYARIEREIVQQRRSDLTVTGLRQTGTGKGDAVRAGFEQANGDVLMILDADATVSPADLPQFLEAIAGEKAEFVNGSRLVYPRDDEAMRFLNVIGNKLFARIFSYLLDQPLKDTLCGTKVFRASDYARIARGRSYFGDFDPFGDFDLLFGASKLNLKIAEIPVRYGNRTYGETNINRFRDGAMLFRMSWFALRRVKLI
jgi:SAM-dependent methyltransferase